MTRLSVHERREALVAATLRLVTREGVAAATTRAIVAEAGMPLGAFHYAFASREELLARVVSAVTEDQRLVTAGALADVPPGACLAEVLHAGLVTYVRLIAENPAHEQAMLELTLYSLRHGLDDQARAQYETYQDGIEQNLCLAADATGQAWRVPVRTVARYLLVGVEGLTTSWLALRDTEAALDAAGFLARSLAALADPLPSPPATPGGHADAD